MVFAFAFELPKRPRRPPSKLKKYNIVKCPKCRFVQAIRRRGICKSCEAKLDATTLRILASTNKVNELPALVQHVKAYEALK
jgi:hypothetical protein